MFNRLFSSFRKDPDNKPAIDLSFGYKRLPEFTGYLKKKNFAQLEEAYEGLRWDEKTILNEGIGLDEQYESQIIDWVNQRPDSYVANLFAGVSKTRHAWIARTAAPAKHVNDDAGNKFLTLLEEAADYLKKADEINPDDAEICARTIRVYMGLGINEETVASYFAAAASLQPVHLMAHLMMINYLAPKWFGSIEAMYRFADDRIQETGSTLLVTLKLFAYTEEWLYYSMNGDDEKYKNFFSRPDVKKNIATLYNEYEEQEEGKLLIPYVYNYFAFLFWKMSYKEKAREIIKKIPGKMTVYPWAYIGIESNEALQRL